MNAIKIGLILLSVGALQTLLARIWGLLGYADLLMAAVIYHATRMPFRQAVVLGGVAGLVQDSFGGGIMGMHGLSKTLVATTIGSTTTIIAIRGRGAEALVIAIGCVLEGLVLGSLRAFLDLPTTGLTLNTLLRALATPGAALLAATLGPRIRSRWLKRHRR